MIKRKSKDRASGFLPLFFILMILFSLKPTFNRSNYSESPHEREFFIHIEGDIKTPGVYPFSHRVNITEIINRAGGLHHMVPIPEEFDKTTIESDTRVTVQQRGEEWRFYRDEISAFYKLTLGIPISLNRESEAGLMAIPGIGPGLARSIVRERTLRGGFKNLNEIMSIKGIGDKSYQKISPYLRL